VSVVGDGAGPAAANGGGTVTAARVPAPAPSERTGSPYAGLATRVLAFAIDAAIVDGIALLVGVLVGLGLSLLHLSSALQGALAGIGAALAVVWTIAYFAFFWSASGQTPGNRLLRIRVEDARTGGRVHVRQAVLRALALSLSALLLFAGFLMILVNRRRRALHDYIASTVVVYAPDEVRSGTATVTRAREPVA
jgi:uncharacterized RDD family membrane protein YckC